MFKFLRFFRRKNREEGRYSPAQFKRLSQDIRDLANVIAKLWLSNQQFQIKIKRIKQEMDQLDRLLENKSFSSLSREKKEELRRSLLVSKKELLKCIQEAPCPTKRVQ